MFAMNGLGADLRGGLARETLDSLDSFHKKIIQKMTHCFSNLTTMQTIYADHFNLMNQAAQFPHLDLWLKHRQLQKELGQADPGSSLCRGNEDGEEHSVTKRLAKGPHI